MNPVAVQVPAGAGPPVVAVNEQSTPVPPPVVNAHVEAVFTAGAAGDAGSCVNATAGPVRSAVKPADAVPVRPAASSAATSSVQSPSASSGGATTPSAQSTGCDVAGPVSVQDSVTADATAVSGSSASVQPLAAP